MFATGGNSAGGMTFVDRGDPSTPDFELGVFIAEDTWYDLDYSSIVPAGAKSVVVAVRTSNSSAGGTFYMRTKGHNNVIEGNAMETQVSAKKMCGNYVLSCGSERIMQGFRSNSAFTLIELVITGWFI